ncbi:MAG: 50S ribosomal protein L11 [Mycoplasmataceae bacterium RC_NB112A]|nr:MAG: 50S ribosomal protein L11 [Mycoplasmataceae bacterium RC_NB112A]
MEKEFIRKSNVYLVCPAKPGSSLSFLGKNMVKFARDFNEKNKDKVGEYMKVEIKIFQDGSYEFKTKNTPLTYLLLNRPNNYGQLSKEERKKIREKDRKEITQAEIQKLAQQMLPFLNTTDLNKAQKIVIGTVNTLGIKITY